MSVHGDEPRGVDSRACLLIVLGLVACRPIDDVPPAQDVGGPGAGSLTGASGESGSEEETGSDDGTLDAPCDTPPSFSFTIDPAGLAAIELGAARQEGCLTLTTPDSTCDAESFFVGAAVGDYDEDGLPDLALTGSESTGALVRNLGNGSFEDVSLLANVDLQEGSGVAWGDFDKDGDLDLFVATWFGQANRLYLNQGGGSFLEAAAERGVDRSESGRIGGASVTVADVDLDGWPDIYTTGWRPLAADASISPVRLFMNQGASNPGYFVDASAAAGLEDATRGMHVFEDVTHWFGMSSIFVDLGDDDLPELIAVGDFRQTDSFMNEGDGSFVETVASELLRQASLGMGLAVGDYDLDGDFDVYITAVSESLFAACSNDASGGPSGNGFFENLGDGNFAQAGVETRTRCGGWGWGAAMADFDNDGDLDLAGTNGYHGADAFALQYAEDPDRYWDGQGSFDVPAPQCAAEVGMIDDGQGRGLYPLDVDGDGDLDLLETRSADTPFIYRNEGGNDANWLQVQARGSEGPTTGRGAQIAVRTGAGGPWMVREIGVGSMFMGHGELMAHFGLGGASVAQELRICWPVSRRMQILSGVAAGQRLVLDEADADIDTGGPCRSAILEP